MHLPISRSIVIVLVFLAAFGFAATRTGYVFDGASRAPVGGVEVRLPDGSGLMTDANGGYVISDASASIHSGNPVFLGSSRRGLVVEADRSVLVRVRLVDFRGRLIRMLFEHQVAPGRHEIALPGRGLAHPAFLQVAIGDRNWVVMPLGWSKDQELPTSVVGRALSAGGLDTLRIAPQGWTSSAVLLPEAPALPDTAWIMSTGTAIESLWNQAIGYDTLVDARDGAAYRVVQVGERIWMAENLRYRPAGSQTGCLDGEDANCRSLGRLYSRTEAMGGVPSHPILVRPLTGPCPDGWHVPVLAEWRELIDAAGQIRRLRSTAGWTDPLRSGSDDFGFRAFPFHGIGAPSVGAAASWWTTESRLVGDTLFAPVHAGIRDAFDTLLGADSDRGFIRCVKGAVGRPADTILLSLSSSTNRMSPRFQPQVLSYRDTARWFQESITLQVRRLDTVNTYLTVVPLISNPSSLLVPLAGPDSNRVVTVSVGRISGGSLDYTIDVHREGLPTADGAGWNADADYREPLVDPRNGRVYQTVAIRSRIWMAQNLDFKTVGADTGVCARNDCARFGRLYTWAGAMAGAAGTTRDPSGVRGICPEGWHLPSNPEWQALARNQTLKVPPVQFMATGAWPTTTPTDVTGFRALPTSGASDSAGWWSTSYLDATTAQIEVLGAGGTELASTSANRSVPASVRCVKDW